MNHNTYLQNNNKIEEPLTSNTDLPTLDEKVSVYKRNLKKK